MLVADIIDRFELGRVLDREDAAEEGLFVKFALCFARPAKRGILYQICLGKLLALHFMCAAGSRQASGTLDPITQHALFYWANRRKHANQVLLAA